jgi:hypothetical protein
LNTHFFNDLGQQERTIFDDKIKVVATHEEIVRSERTGQVETLKVFTVRPPGAGEL